MPGVQGELRALECSQWAGDAGVCAPWGMMWSTNVTGVPDRRLCWISDDGWVSQYLPDAKAWLNLSSKKQQAPAVKLQLPDCYVRTEATDWLMRINKISTVCLEALLQNLIFLCSWKYYAVICRCNIGKLSKSMQTYGDPQQVVVLAWGCD